MTIFFIILVAVVLLIIFSGSQRALRLPNYKKNSMEDTRKKINLIFTGGTIAGVVDSKTNSIKASILEKSFFKKIPNSSKLDSIASWRDDLPKRVTILLSEQMIHKEWEHIAAAIAKDINTPNVEGIVVAHGTDTMPFTASAVSFILNEIPIPVIFTGSILPFSQPGSDAPQNLSDSILAATNRKLAGVFIVFPSKNGKTRDIHLAVRTRLIAPYTNYFNSIDQGPIGCIKNGKISLDQKFPVPLSKPKVAIGPHVDPNIEYYRIFPLFNAAWTLGRLVNSNDNQVRAVLLELYHSGTGCTREIAKEYNLTRYISALTEKGVLVFGMPEPEKMYDTSLELQKAGLIFLKRMSIPAAITKLTCVLGQYQSKEQIPEIKQKMSENLRHEISENSH